MANVKPKESTDSIVRDVQKGGPAGFTPRAPKGERGKAKGAKPAEHRQHMDGGMADILA